MTLGVRQGRVGMSIIIILVSCPEHYIILQRNHFLGRLSMSEVMVCMCIAVGNGRQEFNLRPAIPTENSGCLRACVFVQYILYVPEILGI